MAYKQPFTQHDLKIHEYFIDPEVVDKVQQALDRSDKVELHCSSFTDPGDDWTEILINDKPVPGSYVPGY